MNIDYFFQEQPTDCLEVESLGNVCIQCNNDNADEWLINIKTDLGWSTIETFGPLTIDSDYIGYYFNYNYAKFEYNEKKLYSTIYNLLNDKKKEITQAQIIDSDEFYLRLNNLKKDE